MTQTKVEEVFYCQRFQTKAGIATVEGHDGSLRQVFCDWAGDTLMSEEEILKMISEGSWVPLPDPKS